MKVTWQVILILFVKGCFNLAFADTYFVNVDSTNSVSPYSSWTTAATNIQDAVNLASAGDNVLVTNGIYYLHDRISVTRSVIVKSVNGASVTIIDAGGKTGCFYLSDLNCYIEGFTIRNGYNSSQNMGAGGIYCSNHSTNPVVSNCVFSNNVASRHGGGMVGGTINNCVFKKNTAAAGGGMESGIANNCVFSSNTATYGGGIFSGTANNCIFLDNVALKNGGGIWEGAANACIFIKNRANAGYEEYDGGGGMYKGNANNCVFLRNSSKSSGGGMYKGNANNCTFNGNSSIYSGGGMSGGSANNCILWYNQSKSGNKNNAYNVIMHFVCSPDATQGLDGCITNSPSFASFSHLQPFSSCLGMGDSLYVSDTDIDGEVWKNPPSMGCDDPCLNTHGELYLFLDIPISQTGVGFPVSVYNTVVGPCDEFFINFGDGIITTNSFIQDHHTWTTSGAYDVVLFARNASYPNGLSITQHIDVVDADFYVSPTGNDTNDGQSWLTAKRTIQEGVNVASHIYGASVWVTNGVYKESNEISITNSIAIQSINGPEVTIVDGGGVHRCFNLGNFECYLNGFSITNGNDSSNDGGGGVYCSNHSITPVVSNCVFSDNSATAGGGMKFGRANNCMFVGNFVQYSGGGIDSGIANNCTFTGNSASSGGGMDGGTANNCTFTGNSASSGGGGLYEGIANNCVFSANTASGGGGMSGGTANNCIFFENLAKNNGGGISGGSVNNCVFFKNRASGSGGGMFGDAYSIANNCTFSANLAQFDGGGMDGGTANNCIIWYNQSESRNGNDAFGVTMHFVCSPDVTNGVNGCITNEPNFASFSHLRLSSPCIGAADPSYLFSTDIDGEAWKTLPSIGCDESYSNTCGKLRLFLNLPTRQVAHNIPVPIQFGVLGPYNEFYIDFGDGIIITNSFVSLSHEWETVGSYDVVLFARNASYPNGLSITQHIDVVVDADFYVSPAGNDTNDGQSWLTAKRTIQEGVNEASSIYGASVWVTNGVYNTEVDEISVTNVMAIRSINGPKVTIVDGCGSHRCFNFGNIKSCLEGFSIINGNGRNQNGGGVYCSNSKPTVLRCIFRNNGNSNNGGGMYKGTVNSSIFSGNVAQDAGGGFFDGVANNCVFFANTAGRYGGGMSGVHGIANNCTFSTNLARYYNGGGMSGGTANNCIIWYNQSGSTNGNDAFGVTMRFVCSPDVTNGVNGCITNKPYFVNIVSTNLHLHINSPCIDKGGEEYAFGLIDLAGNPRVLDGDGDGIAKVDIGAYEYELLDSDGDGMPNAWEDKYGLNSFNASDGATDLDGDGLNNFGEYVAGCDPTNAASFFWIISAKEEVEGFFVRWDPSIDGRIYKIFRAKTLSTNELFSLIETKTAPECSYTDYSSSSELNAFYKVRVELVK